MLNFYLIISIIIIPKLWNCNIIKINNNLINILI